MKDITVLQDRIGYHLKRIGDPNLAAEQLGFRAETTLAKGLALTLDVPKAAAQSEPRPRSVKLASLVLSRCRSASKPPKNPSSWFFTDD